MTDPNHIPADDIEALSAYLAGELAEPAAADFEARLAAEPALARQADALAAALVSLRAVDDAVLPQGFEQRLEQRLATERRGQPTDLVAYRERRSRSTMWLKVGTAVAVVAAAGVMSAGALRQLGGGGGADSARTTVAEDGAGSAEGADDQAAFDAEEYAAAPDSALEEQAGPVIIDERAIVADEDALRRRYRDLPEVDGVLGLALPEARPLARRFTAALGTRDLAVNSSKLSAQGGAEEATDHSETEAAAPRADEGAVSGGGAQAAGDPCLAGIMADARAPLVPVRVETLRYDGAEAISYVLVTATPGSQKLDRTEVWVVAPDDCATIVFQQY